MTVTVNLLKIGFPILCVVFAIGWCLGYWQGGKFVIRQMREQREMQIAAKEHDSRY